MIPFSDVLVHFRDTRQVDDAFRGLFITECLIGMEKYNYQLVNF